MRKLLEQNKIFFETIAAVLLSGMAVAVSYFQYQVSERQTDLIEHQNTLIDTQTRLSEAQALPVFDFSWKEGHTVDGQSTGNLSIDNSGGPATSFQCEAVYVVKLEDGSEFGKIDSSIKIYVQDYFTGTFGESLNTRGHLFTFPSEPGIQQKVWDLVDQVLNSKSGVSDNANWGTWMEVGVFLSLPSPIC